MTFTVLASLFLVLILLIAFIGFKAARTQPLPRPDMHKERCSICRQQFNKNQLIERQVGDYRVLFFCRSCITGLHAELLGKN